MNLEQLIKNTRTSGIKHFFVGIGFLGMLSCATEKYECVDRWYFLNENNQIMGPYNKCGATIEKTEITWCAVKTAAKNVYVFDNQEGTEWKYCNNNDIKGCISGDWYYQGNEKKLIGPFNGCINENLDSTSKSWCVTKAIVKNIYIVDNGEGTLWSDCNPKEGNEEKTSNVRYVVKADEYVPENSSNQCENKYFEDNDGDGYGNPYVWICEQLPGYVKDNSDYDDSNKNMYPEVGKNEQNKSGGQNCGSCQKNVNETCVYLSKEEIINLPTCEMTDSIDFAYNQYNHNRKGTCSMGGYSICSSSGGLECYNDQWVKINMKIKKGSEVLILDLISTINANNSMGFNVNIEDILVNVYYNENKIKYWGLESCQPQKGYIKPIINGVGLIDITSDEKVEISFQSKTDYGPNTLYSAKIYSCSCPKN